MLRASYVLRNNSEVKKAAASVTARLAVSRDDLGTPKAIPTATRAPDAMEWMV